MRMLQAIELFNALTLVEKRTEKLTLQLKENKEAFRFLKMNSLNLQKR